MNLTAILSTVAFSVPSADEILLGEESGMLFEHNNIFTSAVRLIGWMLLKFVHWFANAAFELFQSAYKILTFSGSDNAKSILDLFDITAGGAATAVLWALLTITIIGIGLAMIMGHEGIKGSTVIRNILLGLLFIAILPSCISQINTIITDNPAQEIKLSDAYRDSVYDLKYIYTDTGAKGDLSKKHNQFSGDQWIDQIEINEVLKGKDFDGDIDDVFYKKVDDGKIVESSNIGEFPIIGYLDWFAGDYYYRYHYDFFYLLLLDVSCILVMIFSTFKIARIAYELVIHELFAEVLAVTDIASGAKFREVLKSIFSCYIVLLYIPIAVQLYVQFQVWLNQLTGLSGMYGSLIKALLNLAVAMAVIDGPNLIERIFGIDAGIKSGFHTMMGLAHAARGAASLARGVGRVATAPARAVHRGMDAVRDYAGVPTLREIGQAGRREHASDAYHRASDWAQSRSGNSNGTSPNGGGGSTGGAGRSGNPQGSGGPGSTATGSTQRGQGAGQSNTSAMPSRTGGPSPQGSQEVPDTQKAQSAGTSSSGVGGSSSKSDISSPPPPSRVENGEISRDGSGAKSGDREIHPAGVPQTAGPAGTVSEQKNGRDPSSGAGNKPNLPVSEAAPIPGSKPANARPIADTKPGSGSINPAPAALGSKPASGIPNVNPKPASGTVNTGAKPASGNPNLAGKPAAPISGPGVPAPASSAIRADTAGTPAVGSSRVPSSDASVGSSQNPVAGLQTGGITRSGAQPLSGAAPVSGNGVSESVGGKTVRSIPVSSNVSPVSENAAIRQDTFSPAVSAPSPVPGGARPTAVSGAVPAPETNPITGSAQPINVSGPSGSAPSSVPTTPAAPTQYIPQVPSQPGHNAGGQPTGSVQPTGPVARPSAPPTAPNTPPAGGVTRPGTGSSSQNPPSARNPRKGKKRK